MCDVLGVTVVKIAVGAQAAVEAVDVGRSPAQVQFFQIRFFVGSVMEVGGLLFCFFGCEDFDTSVVL